MKLVTFVDGDEYRSGVVTDHGVADVAGAASALGVKAPTTIAELDDSGLAALSSLVGQIEGNESGLLAETDLTLGPCVSDPGKIICIGLNYAKHAAETNTPIPTHPVVFSKFSSSLSGHGEDCTLIT